MLSKSLRHFHRWYIPHLQSLTVLSGSPRSAHYPLHTEISFPEGYYHPAHLFLLVPPEQPFYPLQFSDPGEPQNSFPVPIHSPHQWYLPLPQPDS